MWTKKQVDYFKLLVDKNYIFMNKSELFKVSGLPLNENSKGSSITQTSCIKFILQNYDVDHYDCN